MSEGPVSPPAHDGKGSPAAPRRQLLRGGFWAGVGVLLVGGLASAFEFFTPTVSERFGDSFTVKAADVPRPGAPPFHHLDGKFWLVNLKPGDGSPIQFRRFGAPSQKGGLLALSQRCTHLGCTVPWRPDFDFGGVMGWFNCPCHTAIYTKAGLLVLDAAVRPMDTFPIVGVSSSGVRVNTGHVLLGAEDDPQRTVPAGPFG